MSDNTKIEWAKATMRLSPTPDKIKEIQQLFNSITCLCVEGPEFHRQRALMEAILKVSMKGYDLCTRILTDKED